MLSVCRIFLPCFFVLAGEGLFPRPHPERSFNVTHWFIYDLPVFFRKGRRVTLHRPVSETIIELTLSLSFLYVFLCGIPCKGKCSCFCRSVVRASPHRQCRLIVALYDALLLPVSSLKVKILQFSFQYRLPYTSPCPRIIPFVVYLFIAVFTRAVGLSLQSVDCCHCSKVQSRLYADFCRLLCRGCSHLLGCAVERHHCIELAFVAWSSGCQSSLHFLLLSF